MHVLPSAAFAALGGTAAPFFAWAWNNESQIKECELAHTGVTYTEINGIHDRGSHGSSCC